MELIRRIISTVIELHPIHPMMVHFPIALTGAGALLILLAIWKKNKALEQAAFANIVLASFGTLAAGATGMMDNLNVYDGTAPNSTWKMLLAMILLAITATASIARWRNPNLLESRARGLYVAAYLISFALALILAFLGGIILYGFSE
jgi:uncharacterized membrane protein